MARRTQHEENEAQGQQSALNPFLKATDITKRMMFALTGWNKRAPARVSQGISFPEQIVIEVTDEHDKKYDFGIAVGSPNHKTLHLALGPDPMVWQGSITVERQQGRRAPFIAIVEAARRNPNL